MKKRYLLLLLGIALFTSRAVAQADGWSDELLLHHQSIYLPTLDLPIPQIDESELIDGHYFRVLQFSQLPDETLHRELAAAGIELLAYLPYRAYFARIPAYLPSNRWLEWPLRSVSPIAAEWKVEPTLWTRDARSTREQTLELNIRYFAAVPREYVREQLEKRGFRITQPARHSAVLRLEAQSKDVERLSQLPFISYVEAYHDDIVLDDDNGRTLHRSNLLDGSIGNRYDGSGVAALVRDDGKIGPHIDFRGRLLLNEGDDNPAWTHGDQVSGILAGAGNRDPLFRGMAAGVDLYATTYSPDFYDGTLDLHIERDVLVTNSSYTDGCNAGYTLVTQVIDDQLYRYPTLAHVFAAGNSGQSDCGYGAGNHWGTITGGHKQGKNAITTGNLAVDGSIYRTSSRGPAFDGRIKPDLCARGQGQGSTVNDHEYDSFGGTSAAAPGMAGIVAQLHQAYRELNGGSIAPTALLKSALLNTCNELHTPGPDFRSGWGQVNAYRALRTLEDQRYATDSIGLNEEKTHSIVVPEGTQRIKIMLYWAEPPAAPNVSRSLINDLDLTVAAPDGSVHLPWLLDHFPDPNRLDAPAQRGADHLNNVEQVSFDLPEAGVYELRIAGTELPFGKIEYYWTYEIISEAIRITHPVGGENWEAGQETVIHWDAPLTTQDFTIEYSPDAGTTWQRIFQVPAERRRFMWRSPPNALTGQALIRVSRDGESSQSDTTFSIAPRPLVEVTQVCDREMAFRWFPIAEAEVYEVYQLGDKYMEPIAETTDTEYRIAIPTVTESANTWLAVKARGADWESERSVAVNNPAGDFVECIINQDLELNAIESPNQSTIEICTAYSRPVVINLRNSGEQAFTELDLAYQVDDGPVITESYSGNIAPGQSWTHTFQTPIFIEQGGQYRIQTWVTLANDENPQNNRAETTIQIIRLGDREAPEIYETFEQVPPAGWLINNPDSMQTWESYTGIGPTGVSTALLRLPHFDYLVYQALDRLVSVPVDLRNSITPALSFYRAYAPHGYSSRADSFRIDVFTDCGDTFEKSIFGAAGNRLATHPTSSTVWEPGGAEDWRERVIDLTEFAGEEILLKLVSINYRGNHFYLSDWRVFESQAPPVARISTTQDKACVDQPITVSSSSEGFGLGAFRWDFGPQASIPTAEGPGPWEVSFSTADTQSIKLWLSNPHGMDSTTIRLPVVAPPLANFNTNLEGLTINLLNQSTEASGYQWDFGDGQTSTLENPIHTYAEPGTYTIELTVFSDHCEPIRLSKTVEVSLTSSVRDRVDTLEVSVYPNPNRGDFRIQVADLTQRELVLELYTPDGLRLWREVVRSKAGWSNYRFTDLELARGLYFLRVEAEEKAKVLKVLVQ